MAALTRLAVQPAGTTITYASAAGGGDTYQPATGREHFQFRNRDATSTTVTVTVFDTVQGLARPARTLIVPAAAGGIPGEAHLPMSDLYKDPANGGRVSLAYSKVTTFDVAVVDY